MYMDVQQLGKSLVYIFTYLQYTYCSQNNSLHKYEDNIILWTIYVHLFSISLVLFNLKVLFLFFILTGIPPTGSRDRIYWGDGCVCSRPTPGTWGPRPPDTHRLHDNTKSPDWWLPARSQICPACCVQSVQQSLGVCCHCCLRLKCRAASCYWYIVFTMTGALESAKGNPSRSSQVSEVSNYCRQTAVIICSLC